MEEKLHEEYGAIIYTIRKNCRFDYENDNDDSLSKKEWMDEDEETCRIKALVEK